MPTYSIASDVIALAHEAAISVETARKFIDGKPLSERSIAKCEEVCLAHFMRLSVSLKSGVSGAILSILDSSRIPEASPRSLAATVAMSGLEVSTLMAAGYRVAVRPHLY